MGRMTTRTSRATRMSTSNCRYNPIMRARFVPRQLWMAGVAAVLALGAAPQAQTPSPQQQQPPVVPPGDRAAAARSDSPKHRPDYHRRHRPRQHGAVHRRSEEGRLRGVRGRGQAGCRRRSSCSTAGGSSTSRRRRRRRRRKGSSCQPARPTNDASGRIFIIFVDDLHLDFRNTGRIRDLFKQDFEGADPRRRHVRHRVDGPLVARDRADLRSQAAGRGHRARSPATD